MVNAKPPIFTLRELSRLNTAETMGTEYHESPLEGKKLLDDLLDPNTVASTMLRLYELVEPSIIGFVYNQGGEKEQGREILHEVVLEFCTRVIHDQKDDIANPQAYLMQMALYTWQQTRKTGYRLHEDPEEEIFPFLADQEPGAIFRLEQADSFHRFQQIIMTMEKRCREILMKTSGLGGKMVDLYHHFGFQNARVGRNFKMKCKKQLLKRVEQNPALKSFVQEYFRYSFESAKQK
ncbi:MAG: hypothetical protein AAFR61_30640 [Bacteroidota bacterium]